MKEQIAYLYRTIWKFSKWLRKKLIITCLFHIITFSIEMSRPLLFWLFINAIQTGWPDVVYKSGLILWSYLGIGIIFWVFYWPARIWERELAASIETNFIDDLYKTITELPISWHKDHHSGETIDKVNRARQALFFFIWGTYNYIKTSILLIVSFIAVMIILKSDWLILLPFWIIIFLIIIKLDNDIIKFRKNMNKIYGQFSATLQDYMTNIITVITLRLESLSRKTIVDKHNSVIPLYHNYIRLNESKWCTLSIIIKIAWFMVVFYYVWKVHWSWNAIQLGTITMLYSYFDQFTWAFFGMAWQFDDIIRTSTDLIWIKDIIKDHERLCSKPKSHHSLSNWTNITISKLNFKYEDEHHKIHNIKDVNLNLQKWHHIAIIWESWSWKSTILTILRWLIKADTINIKIDWDNFDSNSILSSLTSLIPQDPEIFEQTIEYNITLWLECSSEELNRIIEMACLEKVINKLPKWVLTNIKEKWVNLSGWEKQRLALARWLFASKENSIILLDEPTSSIDSINEQKIYSNILKEFKDKCVISNVHKLNLLHHFDSIYVVDKWRIIEHWSFKYLINKKWHFHAIWKDYNGASSRTRTGTPVSKGF